MRPIEYKITKKFLKEEYLSKKKTMQEIAKMIGCGLCTIMRNLEKFGIKRRPTSETKKGELNSFYKKCDVECVNCGKVFHIKVSRKKRSKNICCSRKCSTALRKTQVGKEAMAFKEGQTLKQYFCIECGQEVGLHSGIYGEGRCNNCRAIQNGKNLAGENHPMWQGGITFEPYTSDWTKTLREAVRDRDNRTCQNPSCNCSEKANGQALEVHHIDYDKEHSVMENLISLCINCHRRTNANRKFWTTFYNNIILQLT